MNHVMVVDDEAPMRAALEAQFRRDGWDVLTAYGANDALAKFKQAPCPLVVTDMRMPDGDGLRVMRGLREMDPHVGVVFLTAFGSVPEAVRAMHEGACDYLVKPVCFDQLKDVAERVLGRAMRGTVSEHDEDAEDIFVGESEKLQKVLQRARQVAQIGRV
jgi:DNA-binding NtrC family response regulator